MKRRTVLIVVMILVWRATTLGAATNPPAKAPITPIRSEISLLLELHNFLLVGSKGQENTLPEFSAEVKAYREAQSSSKDPAVWQFVNDACVTSKDVSALLKTADTLPSTLFLEDREAALKVLAAIASAWPRFEAKEMIERNRSLQTILTKNLRRYFNGGPADRVLVTLQEKMILKPLDAPVTLYPVIGAIEAGAWGKTPQGFYIVIPVRGRPTLILLENIIHELTHLLEVNQVQGTNSILARLRHKGAGADPATLESFIHGLVAWNAGEMIKRFIDPRHKAVVDLSPESLMKMEPYLPIYTTSWVSYLEGKASADQTVDAMIEAFRKIPPPKPETGS